MTSTSYPEFKKLFDRIPKDRLPYVHFIPLRTGTKVPIGTWKGKVHLTLYECKDVLKTGGNIAIAGIPKGVMFLDIDTDNKGRLLVSEELLSKIPNTFTVRSVSGGLHFYWLNNSEWDNQKFRIRYEASVHHLDDIPDIKKTYYTDHTTNRINTFIEVGELRTNWQYVVSCGSWVNPETYRIINDIPINQFTGDITAYFKSGNVKDLTPNRPAPTEGKKGIPLSNKHKEVLERMKAKREGKIEPDIKTNAEKKEELLTILRKRGYKV